jgi:AraC-like DNA-binding protein
MPRARQADIDAMKAAEVTAPAAVPARRRPPAPVTREIPALFTDQPPQPLHLRGATIDPHSVYPLLRHTYGELIYSFSGVIEITVGTRHYLAPPHHGVWIPPAVHIGGSRDEVRFSALCLDARYSASMPAEVCTLAIAPLARTLLGTLQQRGADYPRDEAELRLFHVLIDELRRSQPQESYLPMSDDAQLRQVLQALQQDPACDRSLQQWADAVHSTERTLSRRCQRDLGMSFSEWTQRLRLLRALSLLQGTQSVHAIALDLGYSSASAFIAMFQRRMGDSPEAFRRRNQPLA